MMWYPLNSLMSFEVIYLTRSSVRGCALLSINVSLI